MNNIKVRTKLIIVMVVSILALTACVTFSNNCMEKMKKNVATELDTDKRASYDEQIKTQVENVISLCQYIYKEYEAGKYTLDESKKFAAHQIRQLRYGDNGYFWVDT